MDQRYILGLIVGVVMAWFAVGIIYNLRHGEAVLRWMQGGLPKIGQRTGFRWLGSSVAVLNISQARAPFRQFESLLVLAPRDVPWLWLLASIRGRRDTLVLRGQPVTPPKVDLELADRRSWSGRSALGQAAKRGWESQSYRDRQLMAPPGTLATAAAAADRLSPLLDPLGVTYWRFSLRRDPPYLEIHVPFPDPRQCEAQGYYEALRALARAVGE